MQNEESRIVYERARSETLNRYGEILDTKIMQVDKAIKGQVVTDETLLISGQAADSKATGDRLKTIDSKLEELKNIKVDKTLSLENMPAEAKSIGDKFKRLEQNQENIKELITKEKTTYGFGERIKIELKKDELWQAPNDGFIDVALMQITGTEDIYLGISEMPDNTDPLAPIEKEDEMDGMAFAVVHKVPFFMKNTFLVKKGYRYKVELCENVGKVLYRFCPIETRKS